MVKRYFILFLAFFIIDLVWLGFVAPKFYKSNIGHLMSDKVNWIAALIFYFVYIFALLLFVVNPAIESGSTIYALKYGALLGFVMYATYDLTNQATLKNWPVIVTVVDLMWGTFVTSITAIIGTKIIEYFKF